MQVAWVLYVLGAELQGNLSHGRYKRIMTWCINVPTFVLMLGNIILSTKRYDDNIESGSAHTINVVVGVLYVLFSVANVVVFQNHAAYKGEPWLQVVCKVQHNDPATPATGSANIHNNRCWAQFILHLVTIACLFYFTIVGLAFVDADKGWMLTDAYVVPHSLCLTTRSVLHAHGTVCARAWIACVLCAWPCLCGPPLPS